MTKRTMDIASFAGVLIALAAIVTGLLIEGGNLGQVLQPTAALIVFGGTFGAILLQYPFPIVLAAIRRMGSIFVPSQMNNVVLIQQMIAFANKARRSGIVSLDRDLNSVQDPFLQRTLTLAIDGTTSEDLRNIMEVALDAEAEKNDRLPAVFESAGGFAPTVGILGAVMGLIQVMQHLDKIESVGRGIAVAFVATVYGVGAANLLFLPIAGKMRLLIQEEQMHHELMLEAVLSIIEGMNPRLIEIKLNGFLQDAPRSGNTEEHAA